MRRLVSWAIVVLAATLSVGFIIPALAKCPIETSRGPVSSLSRVIRHSLQQTGLALGSLAMGGVLLLAVNWGTIRTWWRPLGAAERSLFRRTLFWDAMAAIHVVTWSIIAVVLARTWVSTGLPVVPFAEMGFWLAATLTVYFVVSIPLLVTWLLSIQRHPLMPEWARWTWGVGIALVPMVGVVFHVRVFRRTVAQRPPTPSSP